MPIRPKKPEPPKGSPRETETPLLPRRRRIVPVEAPASAPIPAPEPAQQGAKPKRRRGHAKKDERGKWMPTGDYPGGFCRAPLHGRFNGKAGPGRPKGSRSQDSYWIDELNSIRTVSENGVPKKYRQRELVPKLMMKGAVEHKRPKDLAAINEIARRLFPDLPASEANHSPFGNAALDRELLQQLLGGLQLGEARTGAGDALASALFAGSLGDVAGDDAPSDNEQPWDDENWSAPGAGDGEDDLDED